MSRWIRSLFGRSLALLQIALLLSAGCTSDSLAPTPGTAEHLAPGMIPVPGGVVNAAGGNLMVERTDLTLDSLVAGSLPIGAVYNSNLAEWTWSFGMRFYAGMLSDASGRSFDTSGLADGAAIPGTHWIRIDADTVQTKGGLAHEFDALGRLAAVHWATLEYPRIRYAWSEASLVMAQCTTAASCITFYSIALDASQRPVSATDTRGGRVAEFTWNAAGRLAVAKSPLEVAKGWPGTRYEYSLLGLLTAITNSEGERVEYLYQSSDRIHTVTQVGEGNPSHQFYFYAPGNDRRFETLYTNPLGARTRLYFDRDYRLQEIEFAETGERRTYTWLGLRPATVSLESGATTAYTYAEDDPVAISDPAGNSIQISYQAGGLNQENPRARAIARIEDTLGLVEERSYDGSGRVLAVSNGEGESVDLTYNSVSLVASLTQPTGATLTFPLYGQHGHWLDMDGVGSDKRSFDTTGNPKVESAKGRRGGVLTQEFDANRRIAILNLAATDASGVTGTGAITIERRSDGQILAIRRPYGGDHELGYDALGRLVEQRERVDGQWQATLFERDLAGNTTTRSRPNGMREEWQYDGYGRVVKHRALRYATLEGEAIYTYQDGQLASMFDSIRGSTEQYGYDGAGRLVLTNFGYGETRSLAYDLRSRVTAEALAVPGQTLFDIGFEHDLANRLTRTVDRAAQQTLVEHVIDSGQVAETHYGNGLVRAYAYDSSGLIVGAETRNAANAIIESSTIERSGETNPLRLQVRAATTTPLAATEEEYWLDSGETLSHPGKRVFGYRGDSADPMTYAYDELSNQISVPDGGTYTYNSERNRLLTAGSLEYDYDAAGFLTSRDGVPISWTAAGRIASFGNATAEWDLSGRLVELTFDGVSRSFDLFGGRIQSDAMTGAIGSLDFGDVSIAPASGERIYRHLDARGNVRFATDTDGEVTHHYQYHPYGVDQAFGPGDNRVTFEGKLEIGPFMLLGARVYEPALGRFLSPDPVLTATNQYAYTSGNPVLFMDAAGLWEMTRLQQEAIAAAAVWGFAAAALAVAPPAVAIALWIAVGGLSVSAGIVSLKLEAAFAGDFSSPTAVPNGPSSPPPPPPPPGPPSSSPPASPPGSSPNGPQIRVIVISVETPAPSCSPSTLRDVPKIDFPLPWLLLINAGIGAAWCWRRRRISLIARGGHHRE